MLPLTGNCPAKNGFSADGNSLWRFLLRYPAASTAILLVLTLALSAPRTAAQNVSGIAPQSVAPYRTNKLAFDLLPALERATSLTRFPVILQTTHSGLAPTLRRAAELAVVGNPFAAQPAIRSLNPFGTYAASLTRDQLMALAADRHVLHISPDRLLHACADYAPVAVGADIAWNTNKLSGLGVAIAVLDTGVYTNPDLTASGSRIVGWADLVNNKPQPYDDNGHGTHVAGIIAGNGSVSNVNRYNMNLKRIAPSAQIVAVKVLNSQGQGSVSTVIAGIDWCIANRARYRIRILNLSLGHPIAEKYQSDPLCQAVERAWKAGIFVVCAAGNLGRSEPSEPLSAPAYGTIISPGNDPYVITVGAMNTRNTPSRSDDVIASYSSRGPSAMDFILKPDIVAPGNRIESLAAPGSWLFTTYANNQIQPSQYLGSGTVNYFHLSGTSMAAPVVAGAAALMLQADTKLTPDTLKARLMVSADKPLSPDFFTYGAGYLNIPAALASHITAPLGALSPVTTRTPDGSVIIDSTLWGNNVIWGNNAIWGNNVSAFNAIWGHLCWKDNVIWGNSLWNGDIVSDGDASFAEITAILLDGD